MTTEREKQLDTRYSLARGFSMHHVRLFTAARLLALYGLLFVTGCGGGKSPTEPHYSPVSGTWVLSTVDGVSPEESPYYIEGHSMGKFHGKLILNDAWRLDDGTWVDAYAALEICGDPVTLGGFAAYCGYTGTWSADDNIAVGDSFTLLNLYNGPDRLPVAYDGNSISFKWHSFVVHPCCNDPNTFTTGPEVTLTFVRPPTQ